VVPQLSLFLKVQLSRDVLGRGYTRRGKENGAITNELAMTIDLIKVSPTGYNSHYRKSKQDRPT